MTKQTIKQSIKIRILMISLFSDLHVKTKCDSKFFREFIFANQRYFYFAGPNFCISKRIVFLLNETTGNLQVKSNNHCHSITVTPGLLSRIVVALLN